METRGIQKEYFYKIIAFAAIAAAFFVFPQGMYAQSDPVSSRGAVGGVGTHFEITNSRYLHMVLESSEPIALDMSSVPRMITMMIKPVSSATSTRITLNGFAPLTTYYKYEDDYHNLEIFTADGNGAYAYAQDIARPHFVFIQPTKSTKFIRDDAGGGDCAKTPNPIGTWNATTKTCALTHNVFETIQIDANNITLDGNGRSIIGNRTGYGVYIFNKTGVIVKNARIEGFVIGVGLFYSDNSHITENTMNVNSVGVFLESSNSNRIARNTIIGDPYDSSGIYLRSSDHNEIANNTATSNYYGIFLTGSKNNKITSNTTSFNASIGINLSFTNFNTITGNTVSANFFGMDFFRSNDNSIYRNNFLDNPIQVRVYQSFRNVFYLGLPAGGNYWSDFDTPAEECGDTNNDTMCDSPYFFPGGQDTYPWTRQNGWLGPQNRPPTLSFSQEEGYAADGVNPDKGTASSTVFTLKVRYTDADNNAPSYVRAVVDGAQYAMSRDEATTTPELLRDGNYANGEQYVLAGTSPKGIHAYYFEASDGTDTARVPALGTLTFEAGYSNIFFLPGLEASRLYRPDYSGGTNRLWEPNIDSNDAKDLLLDEDGKSARYDVYTKDVIDNAYIPILGNIYNSFLGDLERWKSNDHLINDYAIIPYDWRLSIDDILNYGNKFPDGRIYYSGDLAATSSPYIIQELKHLAATSSTGKVTIVAHSNGGLVTKALTERLGTEASAFIDKIIFVAVPQAGTPQAIGAILHGYDQGLPLDSFPLTLTSEDARILAKNMPSAYNLLPSENYFTYVDNPVVTFDNSDFLAEFRARYGNSIHGGDKLRNFITDTRRIASSSPDDLIYPSVGNATLFSRAEALHGALDNWTPPQGVSLYEVAGWGEDTLATIEYKEGKKTVCSDPSASTCPYYITTSTLMYNPREVVDGDGTVVAPSALWTPASATTAKYWVNLRKYGNSGFLSSTINRKHADILEVISLRTLINNIIVNNSNAPLDFISTTKPVPEADDFRPRLRFRLHSPLNLSAIDNLGNTVDYATSTIPGSRWKRYGEVQVLTVPKNTPLTLNLNGYATGSFTLDIEEIDENNIVTASSTLSAIPSATSTTATMSFPQGTLQSATPLLVDYDGDSHTDFSIISKIGETVVFDITPPEAVLTFDPILQKLKIIGTDNLSGTTISTTANSTTITDEAGNITEIIFSKLKQEGKEIKVEIQELRYNSVSTGKLPKAVLQYEWSVDKMGNLKKLEEKAMVGTLEIKAHYDVKKNVTKIEKRVKGEEKIKEILSGLVIINLATDKGSMKTSY